MHPVLASVTLTWLVPGVLLLMSIVAALAKRAPVALLFGILAATSALLVGRTYSLAGYGTMLALALTLGSALTVWLASREGFPVVLSATVVVGAQVGALVGARLLHLVVNPSDWARPFALQHGGLVAYGGFFGGVGVAWLLLRGRFLHFADLAAPALGLGLMLTRIGCWFAGCDFGVRQRDTPSWLQVLGTFPALDTPVIRQQRAECVTDCASLASHSFAVHPTQLYESGVGLVLAVAGLLLLRAKRVASHGVVFLVIAAAYGLLRTTLEVGRGDAGRGGWEVPASLAPLLSVVGSLGFLAVVAGWLVRPIRLISATLGVAALLLALLALVSGMGPAMLSTSQLAGLVSAAVCLAVVVRNRPAPE